MSKAKKEPGKGNKDKINNKRKEYIDSIQNDMRELNQTLDENDKAKKDMKKTTIRDKLSGLSAKLRSLI